METVGLLHKKEETQKVSDKFQKRDFVLKTDASTPYPQFVTFQATQDKCSILDKFQEGQEIKVHFNLRGREWNAGEKGIKYFNTLEAWRIESVAQENATPNTPIPTTTNNTTFNSSISDNDDLPF